MPNPNKTAIIIVLDRSGSMASAQDQTISGFNEFIESQKNLPGEALVSLVLFSHEVSTAYTNKPVQNVPSLSRENYQPDGLTALYDAVGQTIDKVGRDLDALPEAEKPGKVVFVIQTDGFENSSRQYNISRVQDLIRQQRDEWQWQFLFLGADQDAWLTGALLGIARGATISYNNTDAAQAFNYLSNTMATYRTGDSQEIALNVGGDDEGVDLRK